MKAFVVLCFLNGTPTTEVFENKHTACAVAWKASLNSRVHGSVSVWDSDDSSSMLSCVEFKGRLGIPTKRPVEYEQEQWDRLFGKPTTKDKK